MIINLICVLFPVHCFLFLALPVLILCMLLYSNKLVCLFIQITADVNDTQLIINELSVCGSDCEIMQVFSSIQGPWAFIFWQVGMKESIGSSVQRLFEAS